MSLVYLPAMIANLVVMNMGLGIAVLALDGVLPRYGWVLAVREPNMALRDARALHRRDHPEEPPHVSPVEPAVPVFAALEQIFAAQQPSRTYLLAASAWALGFFLFGAIVFLARERDFAVRL